MIYPFSLPSINNLGLFDKMVPIKKGLWILPVGTGLLTLGNFYHGFFRIFANYKILEP